jgi:hypothetical protein
MRRPVVVTFLLVATVSAAAWAQPHIRREPPQEAGARHPPDGGMKVLTAREWERATPEQSAREDARRDAERTRLRTALTGVRALTEDERRILREHYRLASRLQVIRRIAEDDGRKGLVDRVDAALAKEDARFYSKLGDLTGSAPGAQSPEAPGGGR